MRELVGTFGRTKNFAIPAFGDRTFKNFSSATEKILRPASETTYIDEHCQISMAKNVREGAMYAEPVEWVSPLGVKLIRNLVTNAKFYMVSIWGKLLQRSLLDFKDPLGLSKTVFKLIL